MHCTLPVRHWYSTASIRALYWYDAGTMLVHMMVLHACCTGTTPGCIGPRITILGSGVVAPPRGVGPPHSVAQGGSRPAPPRPRCPHARHGVGRRLTLWWPGGCWSRWAAMPLPPLRERRACARPVARGARALGFGRVWRLVSRIARLKASVLIQAAMRKLKSAMWTAPLNIPPMQTESLY